jgi:hypothetical protein
MDELLIPQRTLRSITLPDRGAYVAVRALTAAELMRFESDFNAEESVEGRCAAQLAAFVALSDGSPRWTREEGALAVQSLSPRDMAAILKAASELNDIGEEAVEGERKNS